MKQNLTQNQSEAEERNSRAEKLALFGEVKDVELDMRREVDGLLMTILNESTEQEIILDLMLFLYRLSCQKPVTAVDCLEWAATRCYHWTADCNRSQEEYMATEMRQRAARKAANNAAVDVAMGRKMKGGAK